LVAVLGAIRSDRKRWVDFTMKFELGMEERDLALTLLSYVLLTHAVKTRHFRQGWVPA
jgi:hypothetical protein